MKTHVQIVLSRKPTSNGRGGPPRSLASRRLRLVWGTLLFVALATALLAVALVIGTIIALALWAALVLAIVGVILKVLLPRPGGHSPSLDDYSNH